MSEDNLDPNAGGDNQDPNAGAGAAAAVATPPGEGQATWLSEVDPTIKDHPSLQNFKGVGDLAKSHVEMQKLVGLEKLPMPGKPYKEAPDEYSMVFDRLGRPSDPNSYKLPDNLEHIDGHPQVTDEQVGEFKALAHKIGLMPHQVEALYQYQHDRTRSAVEAQGTMNSEQAEIAVKDLRKEYGTAFDGNVDLAKRMIGKFADDDFNSMVDAGLGNHPAFIRFAVKVAKNFGEDGEFVGEGRPSMTMTPEEASKEIAAIKGEALKDPKHPYTNKMHPEHKAFVQKMSNLFAMAHPEPKQV